MELQKKIFESIGIWTLEQPPERAQVIDGQWVLDQKFDADDNWIRNCVRWMVCDKVENNYNYYNIYTTYKIMHNNNQLMNWLRFIVQLVRVIHLEHQEKMPVYVLDRLHL